MFWFNKQFKIYENSVHNKAFYWISSALCSLLAATLVCYCTLHVRIVSVITFHTCACCARGYEAKTGFTSILASFQGRSIIRRFQLKGIHKSFRLYHR